MADLRLYIYIYIIENEMNCHGCNFLQPCSVTGLAQSRYKIMGFFPHMMVEG